MTPLALQTDLNAKAGASYAGCGLVCAFTPLNILTFLFEMDDRNKMEEHDRILPEAGVSQTYYIDLFLSQQWNITLSEKERTVSKLDQCIV